MKKLLLKIWFIFYYLRSALMLFLSWVTKFLPLLCVLQLCSDGKALLDTLQTPVNSGSSNSITAKADYSEGASHVLDVVHEVCTRYRDLYTCTVAYVHIQWLMYTYNGLFYTYHGLCTHTMAYVHMLSYVHITWLMYKMLWLKCAVVPAL